jgi:serine/threonine-protein kinase
MVGRTLGHYNIIEPLGAGGMGEVYRAQDTKLDRYVAVKVLPEALAEDPERLARFEREAKAIAALDHPNIVVVHSVEEAVVEGGLAAPEPADLTKETGPEPGTTVHFITMQLVEGKTLSELIPRNGFPIERFFDLAIPLPDAISAAHEHGIIHRDLKPANVMVSDDGRVRVLDFGLAKLKEDTSGGGAIDFGEGSGSGRPGQPVGAPAGAAEGGLTTGPSAGPTSSEMATEMATVQATSGGSAQPLTEEGKILGTVAYMSPEQAEGKPVDHRTDIFSLGILLYQMATGQQPFKGDTNVSVISSIVKETPTSVTELNQTLPRHLGRIIKRSLEKDIRRRYQTALDLRNDLEGLRGEISSGELVPGEPALATAPTLWQRVAPWAIAAAALAIATVAVLWGTMRQSSTEAPTTPETSSWVIRSPEGEWINPRLAISPDGSRIVFKSANMLHLHQQPGGEIRPLPGTEGRDRRVPFFSPGGDWVGFHQGGKLKRVSVTGGAPYDVCDVQGFGGATWAEDDTIIFSSGGSLARISAFEPGEPEKLASPDYSQKEAAYVGPQMLPKRNAVIFEIRTADIGSRDQASLAVLDLDTRDRHDLSEKGTEPRVTPTGHLLYVQDSALLAIEFDLDSYTARGQPQEIEQGLGVYTDTDRGNYALAPASGTLAYVAGSPYQKPQLTWVRNLNGRNEEEAAIEEPLVAGMIDLSPNRELVAIDLGGLNPDLHVYDLARGRPERPLTLDWTQMFWTWMPDNEHFFFGEQAGGDSKSSHSSWSVGPGQPEPFSIELGEHVDFYPSGISPDGEWMVVAALHPLTGWDLMLVPMRGERVLQELLITEANEFAPEFSPDGSLIAYVSDFSGQGEVYVKLAHDPDRKESAWVGPIA